jgi:DNA-binding HxlR family transcriptional regulator
MARPDVNLLEALADQASIDLLRCLLHSDDPLTQGELAAKVEISSGLASKRMGMLELLGLVERPRSHGPYKLVLAAQTRALLDDVADLAASALRAREAAATSYARDQRKEGLNGGHLRDQQKESHG